AMHPEEEADVRALIGLLERTGEAAAALTAYQEHAKRLASDLELEPDSETQQLAEDIRHRREQRAAVLPSAPASPWADQATDVPLPNDARRARVGPGHLVLALLLTALGAVAWRGWTAARVPPGDPQLVVVAPWRVASTDTSLAYLVEGFPDLVAG